MMIVSILVRSLIDFSVIDTKPYLNTLAERFHRLVADDFENALTQLIEVCFVFLEFLSWISDVLHC